MKASFPACGHRRLINCTGECRAIGVKCCADRTGCNGGSWPVFSMTCRNTVNAGTHYVDCAKKARDLGWDGNGTWWYCSSLDTRTDQFASTNKQGPPQLDGSEYLRLSYRGHLAPEFSPATEMLLGKRHQAHP